jgi:hypothetical protein
LPPSVPSLRNGGLFSSVSWTQLRPPSTSHTCITHTQNTHVLFVNFF